MNKILRYEITDRCNQRCEMCWSVDWKHTDMKWLDIEKMFVNFSKENKNGIVVLTSREPLLSPYFKQALLLTKDLGLEVKLLSNATLFNDDNCKLIMNSNINFISLSIHGNQNYHDSITRVKGSYKRTIMGLKNINRYKKEYNREDIMIRITTVINKDLIKSIDEIINIAKNNNCELRIQHLMWHNDYLKNLNKKMLKDTFNYNDNVIDGFEDRIDFDYNYVIKLLKYAKEECIKQNVELQIYPDLNNKIIKEWYSNNNTIYDNVYCDHVKNSIRMRANGDITLCQYIDKYICNAKNNNYLQIADKAYDSISKKLLDGELFPICMHCCHLRFKDSKNEKGKNKKI